MKIQNINKTSDNICSCGSWLNHWKKFSGQTVIYCPASSCHKTDLVGAHVQKANSSDNKWYIFPLCNSHNQHSGVLEVISNYNLVSANKSETCG